MERQRLDIGFTGTRAGMTEQQRLTLLSALTQWHDKFSVYVHHGCCVGADHEMVLLSRYLGYAIVAHPPQRRELMSDVAYDLSDFVRPEAPYLSRNRSIVDAVNLMYAAPKRMTPQIGGTWHTIWYAQETNTDVVIIRPDGGIGDQ